MEKGRIKYIFPGGNTCRGFVSFYPSGLENMDQIFILKGGPGTGKSTLIRKIGREMIDKGYNIEFWQCSSDNNSLDGVIIPTLKAAIVDGTAPHIVEPKYPGIVDEIVNLGDHWDISRLKSYKNEVIKLTNEVSASFSTTYQYLKEAKTVHDQWEKIHIDALDFQKANEEASRLTEEIFSNIQEQESSPRVRHLFASAITPLGMVNYIDNITADCQTRYIVKGLPGTGKSTLTKKIIQAAVEKKYDVNVCHCSLDPDSVDMVLIPQLGTAVIDGTPPHLIDPERRGDKVVDMLNCLNWKRVSNHASKLAEIELEFTDLMREAVNYLYRAKTLHDDLEAYYIKAMDFEGVDETRNKVFCKILAMT
ncbi:MAG: PRK06851 family protein [Bacillota bacterium]|jgi:Cdc6-like AAA superfamily ATPase